jgi:hypothetical protein
VLFVYQGFVVVCSEIGVGTYLTEIKNYLVLKKAFKKYQPLKLCSSFFFFKTETGEQIACVLDAHQRHSDTQTAKGSFERDAVADGVGGADGKHVAGTAVNLGN